MRRFGHELALAGLLLALMLTAGVLDPQFVSLRAQLELGTRLWELALIAVPMLLIVLTGGIDLSVGSALALSAVVLGLAFERGVSPGLAALLAVGVGGALGALNGLAISRLRVHPLIVTLASLAAFRGVAEGISLGRPISGFPDRFQALATGPWPPFLVLLSLGLASLVLARGVWGRTLFAMGHNEDAARYSGLAVDRTKFWLYTLAGLASGVAAVILVARRNTAKADLGTGLELEVITAVVLGGASINGGRGSVLGLILGLLVLHQTREFLSWYWQRSELNLIVLGVLLVLSVLAHRLVELRGSTHAR